MKRKWPLTEDSKHATRCHQRWYKRINRDPTSSGYRDEWYAQQCLTCRYFIGMMGALAEDYGVCSNPVSPFDGVVRFEHDGCDAFDEAVEGTPP